MKIISTTLPRINKGRFARYITALGFIAIYAILLFFFKPELLFSSTTTAGGDMGTHHYIASFLINDLLPKGKIVGWSMGWYAGFPMLYFYFPFPYLIIALFNLFTTYEVAFKLGTVLGIFLLPATTYLSFRVLKFRFPFPLVAAAFSLLFLFMESYSIYGANILSTLAGEFGYSLSFSLTILFLALLYRDVQETRFRVSTGVLLGIIVISHLIPTIMIVLLMPYYLLLLIRRFNAKQFAILAGVFGLGFVLSAFWGLPFVAKIGYTAHMKWDQLHGLNELFPDPVRPFLILSAVGILSAVARRDRRMYFFLWALILPGILFFVLPPGRLWNGRILPFFYYSSFIWAAYGIWGLRRFIAQLFYEYIAIPRRYADPVVAAIAVGVVAVSILGVNRVADEWIQWNYSGYEGKETWSSFNAINQYIKKLPPGRVMWEHSPTIDKLGTPRCFELLPYFADHPSMEGLLMEASYSAPYHFVNQAELSKQPSHAIIGVNYPPLNVDDGVRHLKVFNVRYFMAVSDEVKREADRHPELRRLKRFKVPNTDLEFALYELDTEGYVTIPKNKPVLIKTDDWRESALRWYANRQLLDTPLIDARKAGAQSLIGRLQYAHSGVSNIANAPIATAGSVRDVTIEHDEIAFTTTAVGVPHLVKVSYFPNWKAEGADGPYLASPSFMMVIPKQKHVRLYYGSTAVDTASAVLSALGWLFVLGYALSFAWRRYLVRLRFPIAAFQGAREARSEEAEGRSA